MDSEDVYNDEDLALDDVEYFKEFLKFKKSRALLKAREAQSKLALDVDSKAAGAIEIGSNPPPPGTDVNTHLSESEPRLLINPERENGQEIIINNAKWLENKTNNAAATSPAVAEQSASGSIVTRDSVELKSEAEQPDDRQAYDNRDRRDAVRDRNRGRDERERDRLERTRKFESRNRRLRSRSREREQWRPQRRSRSRSPRSDRPRRDSREGRDSRDSRDFRKDVRDRDPRPRYEPSHNFAPQFEPQYDPMNYGFHQNAGGAAPMPPPGPSPMTDWDQSSAPALSWAQNIVSVPLEDSPEEKARKLAIEREAMQQKQTFISQQKEYIKKREVFVTELGLLKNQRRELGSSKLPDVQRIVTENLKLQDEIATKIKSVDNVLDMLKGLIGDVPPEISSPLVEVNDIPREPEKKKKKKKKSRSSSSASESHDEEPRRSRSRKRSEVREELEEQMSSKQRVVEERPEFNLVFYDPEVHWCRPCKAFPPTAKEYLLHLHSQSHKDITQDKKLSDLPWHELSEHKEPVTIRGLETKRCPIKGLQFFEASTAWFCKLCHSWMGDLHCASLHLKSIQHNQHYEAYSSSNPKWEASWLSDRGKAAVASGKKEDILKRQLEEQLLLQKKHEDELKSSLSKAELLMPFTLQTKPAPKYVKDKSKKKDKKKGKKKKQRRSESASDSSASSSSSSSSMEDEKPEEKPKIKKAKKKSKIKVAEPIKAAVPERSKWEKEDSEDERNRRAPTPEIQTHPIIEARKVRNYRQSERGRERHSTRNSSKPTRAPSPPHVPEKHTILIPESSKVDEKPGGGSSKAPHPPPTHVRTKSREAPPEDIESWFDRQTQVAAKKKPVASKTKFAFIGRMPFAKRRPETGDEKPKDRKEQDVATPDPTPPPPPMISQKPEEVKKQPPPVLTSKTRLVVAKEILNKSQSFLQQQRQIQEARPIDPVLMEEDMEIDKPEVSPPHIELPPSPPTIRPSLPPEVTTNLGKKIMAIPLPKDFQEALSIIYPEMPRAKTPPLPKAPPPPSARIPSPPAIVLPPRIATPPPPLPPDLDIVPPAPSPPNSYDMFPSERACVIPKSRFDDFDEMELLGIDKEDMAAQRF